MTSNTDANKAADHNIKKLEKELEEIRQELKNCNDADEKKDLEQQKIECEKQLKALR